MYHSLMLVRFGRFDEIAGIGDRPKQEISAGVWDFAQGYAQLRRGDVSAAAGVARSAA